MSEVEQPPDRSNQERIPLLDRVDSTRAKIETRMELSSHSGIDLDPTLQYIDELERLEKEGFDYIDLALELYFDKHAKRSLESYNTAINDWTEFMEGTGRHPACPNGPLVLDFVQYLNEVKENGESSIVNKLICLGKLFDTWREDGAFLHGEEIVNPFRDIRKLADLKRTPTKEFHPLELSDLRNIVQGIWHLRDAPIVITQLKLGLRATELCNIEIQDVTLGNSDIRKTYSEIGSNPNVKPYSNAIYIPHTRQGNKSKRPRVLPLDGDLRRILTQYLLVRPDNGEQSLFLTKSSNSKMERDDVNAVWTKYFPEKFLRTTDQYEGITSKFGRHWFTTYWKVHEDINRTKIKYMRGDKIRDNSIVGDEAINEYIHPHYNDIRELYLDRIFKLGV